MDGTGLILTILLVVAGLSIYVLFRWGMDEYGCDTRNYTMMGAVPCYIIYLGIAILVALFAIWLYGKIMQRGNNASYLITLYYIAIVVGIVIVSWYFFSHNPSTMQWVGIGLVVLGLILYAWFIDDNNNIDEVKDDV